MVFLDTASTGTAHHRLQKYIKNKYRFGSQDLSPYPRMTINTACDEGMVQDVLKKAR